MPVPLIVLVAVVVLVVLWPRLAPAPVSIPDERPLAIPTATHAQPAGDLPAPHPRAGRRDPAALAAQAPPGPELAIGARPGHEARRRRARTRRGRRRPRRDPHGAARPPVAAPSPPVARVVAPRRRDGDLLP